MALNYAVLHPTADLTGSNQNLPCLPVKAGGQRLALATASGAIAGPCELLLMPDENQWFDCQPASAALDSANSPIKLIAGQPRAFRLPAGSFRIQGSIAP